MVGSAVGKVRYRQEGLVSLVVRKLGLQNSASGTQTVAKAFGTSPSVENVLCWMELGRCLVFFADWMDVG